jgi:hypothetical protein
VYYIVAQLCNLSTLIGQTQVTDRAVGLGWSLLRGYTSYSLGANGQFRLGSEVPRLSGVCRRQR